MFHFLTHRVGSWTASALLALVPLGAFVPLSAAAVRHTAHAVKYAAPHAAKHVTTGHVAAAHGRQAPHGRVVAGARRGKGAGRRSAMLLTRGRHGHMIRTRYVEHFSAPSFSLNSDRATMGDQVGGEDPLVRASLLEALGNYNGTALAIDPKNGRVLSMVNQKMALGPGAEPCSTIKLTVALAALSEGIITKDTPVNVGGGFRPNLTYALAKSVNPYFETLGRQMGFPTVKHYANQFGLGELAGYNIAGEQLGIYPDHELPAAKGGVGKMCSFGESVSMTPMQLGAIVAAIANGGSLFYLQHPTSPEQVASFEPRLKRTLDIAKYIPEMLPGMAGAVEANYGTARRLRANFSEFPVLGKTGTCSDQGTRFGWFAGYGDGPNGRIVTVFFLTGGRPTFGPKAAELTGIFYRALASRSYFQQHAIPLAAGSAVAAPVPVKPSFPELIVGTPVAPGSGIPATEPTTR
ncbi:MAG: penicillin-binding transpeptidase domain-containing protein [Janthinobacterium lividum]